MKISIRRPTLSTNAVIMPKTRPGIEKLKLFSEITPMRCFFWKPSALNIPYSYVLASTSESISEYNNMLDKIARKTTTVKRVA